MGQKKERAESFLFPTNFFSSRGFSFSSFSLTFSHRVQVSSTNLFGGRGVGTICGADASPALAVGAMLTVDRCAQIWKENVKDKKKV